MSSCSAYKCARHGPRGVSSRGVRSSPISERGPGELEFQTFSPTLRWWMVHVPDLREFLPLACTRHPHMAPSSCGGGRAPLGASRPIRNTARDRVEPLMHHLLNTKQATTGCSTWEVCGGPRIACWTPACPGEPRAAPRPRTHPCVRVMSTPTSWPGPRVLGSSGVHIRDLVEVEHSGGVLACAADGPAAPRTRPAFARPAYTSRIATKPLTAPARRASLSNAPPCLSRANHHTGRRAKEQHHAGQGLGGGGRGRGREDREDGGHGLHVRGGPGERRVGPEDQPPILRATLSADTPPASHSNRPIRYLQACIIYPGMRRRGPCVPRGSFEAVTGADAA
jgi:hypothetical protein